MRGIKVEPAVGAIPGAGKWSWFLLCGFIVRTRGLAVWR